MHSDEWKIFQILQVESKNNITDASDNFLKKLKQSHPFSFFLFIITVSLNNQWDNIKAHNQSIVFVIFSSLQKHIFDEKIVFSLIQSIHLLSNNSPGFLKSLSVQNLEILIQILSSKCLSYSNILLKIFITFSNNRNDLLSKFVVKNGIKYLLSMLYASQGEIYKNAIHLLYILLPIPQAIEFFINNNGFTIIQKIFLEIQNKAKVYRFMSGIIYRLCQHVKSFPLVLKSNLILWLLSVLQGIGKPTNPILLSVLRTLRLIAQSPFGSYQILKASGTCEDLLSACYPYLSFPPLSKAIVSLFWQIGSHHQFHSKSYSNDIQTAYQQPSTLNKYLFTLNLSKDIINPPIDTLFLDSSQHKSSITFYSLRKLPFLSPNFPSFCVSLYNNPNETKLYPIPIDQECLISLKSSSSISRTMVYDRLILSPLLSFSNSSQEKKYQDEDIDEKNDIHSDLSAASLSVYDDLSSFSASFSSLTSLNTLSSIPSNITHSISTINPLSFNSHFENGNLHRAIMVGPTHYELILTMDPNCYGHTFWFYFSISDMLDSVIYTFDILNMEKPNPSFKRGMRPVMFSQKQYEKNRLSWNHISSLSHLSYCHQHYPRFHNPQQHYYTLSFSLSFPYKEDTVYLASSYPFTTAYQHYLLNEICLPMDKIWIIRRDNLCVTLLGNNCEIITITDFTSSPEDISKRPVFVFTSRVHPSETPSSYVMNGLLSYLSDPFYPTSVKLRGNAVFKIIPLLNPDGIIEGYHRTNIKGVDLNRSWKNPDLEKSPTLYHTKEMIRNFSLSNQLVFFCDIHAHSQISNAIFYGCPLPSPPPILSPLLPISSLFPSSSWAGITHLYPHLCSILSPQYFNFSQNNFEMQSNRAGSSRICFYSEFELIYSYTCEISYAFSSHPSLYSQHLQPFHYKEIGYTLANACHIFLFPHDHGSVISKSIGDIHYHLTHQSLPKSYLSSLNPHPSTSSNNSQHRFSPYRSAKQFSPSSQLSKPITLSEFCIPLPPSPPTNSSLPVTKIKKINKKK